LRVSVHSQSQVAKNQNLKANLSKETDLVNSS
jgi:hypothetical protein